MDKFVTTKTRCSIHTVATWGHLKRQMLYHFPCILKNSSGSGGEWNTPKKKTAGTILNAFSTRGSAVIVYLLAVDVSDRISVSSRFIKPFHFSHFLEQFCSAQSSKIKGTVHPSYLYEVYPRTPPNAFIAKGDRFPWIHQKFNRQGIALASTYPRIDNNRGTSYNINSFVNKRAQHIQFSRYKRFIESEAVIIVAGFTPALQYGKAIR